MILKECKVGDVVIVRRRKYIIDHFYVDGLFTALKPLSKGSTGLKGYNSEWECKLV